MIVTAVGGTWRCSHPRDLTHVLVYQEKRDESPVESPADALRFRLNSPLVRRTPLLLYLDL